jgi:3-deoxy-D-manno-octulosonic-acid transferase
MIAIYTFFLFLYRCILQIASFVVPKAKRLLVGQKQSDEALRHWLRGLNEQREIIWMHCASLGEFEQGRPVLEAIRQNYPDRQILLSFYSPSGFEVRKNTPLADLVVYLPPDYPGKMRQWVDLINPTLFIVVKYELWPNLFLALKDKEVCVFLISGIFREGHRYFGWASFFWKPVLQVVQHYYVQNELSKTLLHRIGIDQVTVSGDTRYDRVAAVAQQPKVDERYLEWQGDLPVVVLGSSYPEEESVMSALRSEWKGRYKWIVAPHHIDEDRIQSLLLEWEEEIVLASDIKAGKYADPRKSVLLLNTMGELGGVYSMGRLAIVGGGWGKGIHNTLEPAAHGLAVLWGPADGHFDEAKALIAAGAGRRCETLEALKKATTALLEDPKRMLEMGQSAQNHVLSNTGATAVFMEAVQRFLR